MIRVCCLLFERLGAEFSPAGLGFSLRSGEAARVIKSMYPQDSAELNNLSIIIELQSCFVSFTIPLLYLKEFGDMFGRLLILVLEKPFIEVFETGATMLNHSHSLSPSIKSDV